MVEFSSTLKRAARRGCALVLVALLSGCATFVESIVDSQLKDYFHEASPAPEHPVNQDLATLKFSEYWSGIVFNGEKIGFSRLQVQPTAGEPKTYEVSSEASFVLRFLGIEKKVNLKAHDTVNPDLTLARFSYDYVLDDSVMTVSGVRSGNEITATIVTGGQPVQQRIEVEGPLYPSSVIALYPVIKGLAIGREYHYRVYSGELQAVLEAKQRVTAYETSQFFEGNAFKIETSMGDQRVLTWIDARGRPVFELGMSGVMISALEEPDRAKRYVALAALNKQESLIDFSIIRPDEPIAEPRSVSRMRVELFNLTKRLPSDSMQRCIADGGQTVCQIQRPRLDDADASDASSNAGRYLEPSITVQSHDTAIRKTADGIVAGAQTPSQRVARIVDWMNANIEKAPLDVFSALDVLEKRKAECQGNAYLYTALARASGVPTRIVNGLAYSEQFNGFLYHSWAESLVDDQWQAVDPTFGQTRADATHIKVVEGETLAELLPIMDLVGKVKIKVLSVEHQTP